MPGFLFSYQKFRKLYEIPIVKEGNETAASNLRRLIGPFVLRRLKKDVMKELPEKVEKIVYSAFSGEQKKLYGASVLRLKEEVESGEEKFKILSALQGSGRSAAIRLCAMRITEEALQSWIPVWM